MIISDDYKYVFLETPRTGSTAIAGELCELYHGRQVIRKHATYYDLLKNSTVEQRKYFVFAGVRNPFDSVVSKYNKLKNNHRGRYTDPAYLKSNGGWLTRRDLEQFEYLKSHDFGQFIAKFYRTPFLNTLNVHHDACDAVIRFEALGTDFEKVLMRLGIALQRPLPVVNKTKKSHTVVQESFQGVTREKIVNVFGPYMQEFGYTWPADWGAGRPSRLAVFQYRGKVLLAKAYCMMKARKGLVKKNYDSSS